MPIKHGKPIHHSYILSFDEDPQLIVEIHGEDLFTYYARWALQNLFKINAWAEKKYVDDLNKEREHYKFINVKIGRQAFYFLVPYFFKLYLKTSEDKSVVKAIFVHDRVQRISTMLTEPPHYEMAPEMYNFSLAKIYKTKDKDLAFAINNRKGRVFTIVKGLLDLAIFCNAGIQNFMTTYRSKKDAKKEIKKEN